jgi:hypothetical protein
MIEGNPHSDVAKDAVKIFAGSSNRGLAKQICDYLGVNVALASTRRFSDGEINVDIQENVRGGDVFVIQSTSTPGNDHLMELLLMLDALKRASSGASPRSSRTTATPARTGKSRPARRSARSSWRTCSRPRARRAS